MYRVNPRVRQLGEGGEIVIRRQKLALSRVLGLTRLREVSRQRLELALEDEHPEL